MSTCYWYTLFTSLHKLEAVLNTSIRTLEAVPQTLLICLNNHSQASTVLAHILLLQHMTSQWAVCLGQVIWIINAYTAIRLMVNNTFLKNNTQRLINISFHNQNFELYRRDNLDMEPCIDLLSQNYDN